MRFAVSPHIEKVHFPPISEVKSWIEGRSFADGKPLVDLCQAVPDYPPPQELLEHLMGAVSDPMTSRYTPDEGLPEVRQAVASWYRRRYGAGPGAKEICLTIGASQAFWLAMTVLCREGDEVVLQAPCYFDHAMGLEMMGVRPVYAPFDEGSAGMPDVDVLASLITPKTRAILLVSPSNPTGAVIPPHLLRELGDLARRRHLALVLDETYNAFIPDGAAPHDLFRDPSWGESLVHIASFGKTFALTGYRAGALVAAEAFIHHALKAQDSMAVCQPRITQQAVRFGCDRLDDWIAENNRTMQRRHDLFRHEFLRCQHPFELLASGGFFAWVKHPFADKSGREVARLLADNANLLCLPGEVFGPGLQRYLRLAFGNIGEKQIAEAVKRFRSF